MKCVRLAMTLRQDQHINGIEKHMFAAPCDERHARRVRSQS